MATNVVSPESILEQIRRARLYNPNFGQGQAQGQIPQQVPQQASIQAPVQAPIQDQVQAPQSSRDQALSQYMEALKQPVPSQADYHPSIGRRIGGVLLGAMAGMHDPKSGAAVGREISYGPFDRKMSEYQKNLARKKEAFEAESAAELEGAKTAEQVSQKGAEESRKGAEESRRKVAEYGISPEGQQFELEKLRIQHPNAAKIPNINEIYRIPLKNGEEVLGVRGTGGQFHMLGDDTPLGSDTYDASKVVKVGTTLPKDPKEAAEKSHVDYNDFYHGMKTKHPEMTDDAIASAWKTFEAKTGAEFQKPPQSLMISPEGVAQRVAPGTKVAPGSTTAGGLSSENVPTAPTRQMSELAPKVIDLVDRTSKLIDEQVKTLGPLSSRWSEFMAGKVGAPNPEFTKLRTNAALLQTLILRMHIGARGGQQILEHFKDLIDVGKQSPENMKAALEEIKAYANDISKSGKSAETPGAKTSAPTGSAPKTKEDFLRLLEVK